MSSDNINLITIYLFNKSIIQLLSNSINYLNQINILTDLFPVARQDRIIDSQ